MRKGLKRILKRLKNGDLWIYFAVVFLLAFGSIMICSAAIGNAAVDTAKGFEPETLKTIIKQILFIGVGIFALLFVLAIYRNERMNGPICIIIYILIVAALAVCLLFSAVNGSHAWIRIPGIGTFQPSEVSKIMMILILSYTFTANPVTYKVKYYEHSKGGLSAEKRTRRSKIKYFIYCYALPILIILLEVGIVMVLQNDTGSALITFLICAACFFVTDQKAYRKGHKILWYIFIGIIIVAGLIALIYFGMKLFGFQSFTNNIDLGFLQGYQQSRIYSWLNPLSDPYGDSAQLFNALVAIAKGGIKGVGLFNSTQKYGFIPEVDTDFITSLIFEELGLIGLALIMIPYGVIIFRCIYHGILAESTQSRIILIGVASYFFVHLFVNLGGVSGLIPMTGVPLVFVSQGGSSVLSGSIAIGLAQAVISDEKIKLRRKENAA